MLTFQLTVRMAKSANNNDDGENLTESVILRNNINQYLLALYINSTNIYDKLCN